MQGPVKRVLGGKNAEQPPSWRGCGGVLGTSCRAHLHIWVCEISALLHQNTDRSTWVPRGCWSICWPDIVVWLWEYMYISYTETVPNQNMCLYWSDLLRDACFLPVQANMVSKDFHQVFSVTVLGGAMCWLLGLLAGRAHESCVWLKEEFEELAKPSSRTSRKGRPFRWKDRQKPNLLLLILMLEFDIVPHTDDALHSRVYNLNMHFTMFKSYLLNSNFKKLFLFFENLKHIYNVSWLYLPLIAPFQLSPESSIISPSQIHVLLL